MTSPALASAICSGDSPRATSDLIRPIMRSNSASSRSTPILDSRSSASASACARARPPRHGAVARHLVGDRRRRPPQLPCHLPAGLALVEAPLDRCALGPVQPAVRLGCLLPHVFPFSREGLRPSLQERILGLSRTCPAEFENES